MSVEMLSSGCAVAQFRGTSGKATDILKRYAPGRNKGTQGSYAYNAHTFVIMSMTKGNGEDFCSYVRKHKLGKAIRTLTAPNINHAGWKMLGGNLVFVVAYQPDHNALTEWYKQFDPNYTLV